MVALRRRIRTIKNMGMAKGLRVDYGTRLSGRIEEITFCGKIKVEGVAALVLPGDIWGVGG